MGRPLRSSVLALALALGAGLAGADTLKLKSGGEVKGEIVSETDAAYVLNTRFGKVTVKKDDVLSVDKGRVDESERLRAKLRGVLDSVGKGEFVLAKKAWDDLREIPSTLWDSPPEQARVLSDLRWDVPEGGERSFRGLERFLAEVTRDLCFPCDGHGDAECATCDGKGREPCRTCKGKPRLCDRCKGKGALNCEQCKGRGMLTCQACITSKRPGYLVTTEKVRTEHVTPTGKVWYTDDVKVTATPCGSCGGTPQYACTACGTPSGPRGRCVPGKIGCDTCQSTGRLPCEAACDRGYSTSPCATCNGTGRTACAQCGGTGKK